MKKCNRLTAMMAMVAGAVLLAGVFSPRQVYSQDNPPVNYPPSITTQPASQVVNAGQSAMFSVTATGSAPLSYQWWFNATNLLLGATNFSLTLSNVQPTDVGNYMVVVTNLVGSVTSSNATLDLSVAPSITAQPTNQTAEQGGIAVFSVMATGTAPLSYQWWFNGTNLLVGATNFSLTVPNVWPTNAGNYAVVVTNVVGSVTSSNGVLTVLPPAPDTDNDGLPDWWEIQYFGNLTGQDGTTMDASGLNNLLYDFQNGINPINQNGDFHYDQPFSVRIYSPK
jgi:hypothetical protein